jgi:hypothetical protein
MYLVAVVEREKKYPKIGRMLSQNDNVRFDQSRNVLLRRITLLPFWKGGQGGKRGPTDDETV